MLIEIWNDTNRDERSGVGLSGCCVMVSSFCLVLILVVVFVENGFGEVCCALLDRCWSGSGVACVSDVAMCWAAVGCCWKR